MQQFALIDLLFEDQWLWEASAASEEAKKYKLKHVGGGAWANQHGIVVAKTNRKTKQLVWLYGNPDDSVKLASPPDWTAANKPTIDEPDAPKGPTVDSQTAVHASYKLRNMFAKQFDVSSEDTNALNAIHHSIIKSIIFDEVKLSDELGLYLSSEDQEAFSDLLDQFVIGNPKNKLANQIKAYYDAQIPQSQKPTTNPTPQSTQKKTSFTPKTVGGSGNYDVGEALGAMGIDTTFNNYDILAKLVDKASSAKTQNDLNYIGNVMKNKLGVSPEQWKAFRKYHKGAYGVLPASVSTQVPQQEPSAPEEPTPSADVSQDTVEPDNTFAPVMSHPDFGPTSELFATVGIETPVYSLSPSDMDKLSAALGTVYDAKTQDELNAAVQAIPFIKPFEKELLSGYMLGTYTYAEPTSTSTDGTQTVDTPPDMSSVTAPEYQFPKDHPDYHLVKQMADAVQSFPMLNMVNVAEGEADKLADIVKAAVNANTPQERQDAINSLVSQGFLSTEKGNTLLGYLESEYPISPEEKAASATDDIEYDDSAFESQDEADFIKTFNALPAETRAHLNVVFDYAMGINAISNSDPDLLKFRNLLMKALVSSDSVEKYEAEDELTNVIGGMITAKTFSDIKQAYDNVAGGDTVTSPTSTPTANPSSSNTTSSIQSVIQNYTPMSNSKVKAAHSSMSGWAKNDPNVMLNWIKSKFFGTKNKVGDFDPGWKDTVMTLVKDYGLDVNNVPDELLPAEVIDAKQNANASASSNAPSMATASEPPQSVTEPQSTPPTEPPVSSAVTTDDAKSFSKGFLANFNVDFDTLTDEQKILTADSVKKALSGDTDFAVMYALKKLKDSGTIKPEVADALAVDIMDKLESQGKLQPSTDDVFKQYFNGTEFLDSFLQSNPAFAAGLSDDDKKKLSDTIRQGLKMPTYQQAKAFYAQELLNKVPGFDETVFQKWRNGLMQYHDELKNLATFITQKKEAVKQQKAEAEAIQKAMQQLASGDKKEAIENIVNAAGFNGMDAQKAMVIVAKALQQPTSQLMFDELNSLYNIPTATNYSSVASTATDQTAKTLRSLVASAYFDQQGQSKISYPEPQVSIPAEARAQQVFDKWAREYGVTLGHFPRGNKVYGYAGIGERNAIRDAVIQALKEPDQKKVNGILNSLFVTTSSMTDKQVHQLRQLVHNERAKPASLDPSFKSIEPKKYTATASTTPTPSGPPPKKDISTDATFKQKSKYYNLPDSKKSEIHDLIYDVLGKNINTSNRSFFTNQLQYKLKMLGIETDTARKVALWATKAAMHNEPIAAKVKQIDAANNIAQGITPSSGTTKLPPPGDANAAKQFVASLKPQQDPYDLASNSWADGEEVIVNSSLQWTGVKNAFGKHAAKVTEQKAWRAKNRPKELIDKFNAGMGSWLGGGQWTKPAQQRKALNEIMTRMVEGPPPQYTTVNTHVERGMSMPPEDFKEYIKAFKIGEPTYIGPSGFSFNTATAHGFGAKPSNLSAEYVKVLLRVKPDKSGKIKAAVLDPFSSEEELVVGTNKQTRTTRIIKHVTPDPYGTGKMVVSYEIELEFDESIQESLNESANTAYGFNMSYWKGLSKDTIKALIKYNNSSVVTNWETQ